MLEVRVIPCLLLKNEGLYKTVKFKDPKYVGDPINAIKIFNEKEVDELIFLDISATPQKKEPRIKLIKEIASECFMPFCYGGGITKIKEMDELFNIGVEKISINTLVFNNPKLVEKAAVRFGSQSIVVSIDVKKNIFNKYYAFSNCGKKNQHVDPLNHARMAQDLGAGELFINSIDQDGTGLGYDLELIKRISESVSIPVIACGGAGSLEDFKKAHKAKASALAAGSFFVFHGKHRAVLITYPEISELEFLFSE